jgi:VTC domain
MSSAGARETRAFASEIKFLVPRATGAAIRDWARKRLGPDPHGSGAFGDEYRVTTIYFDSPEFDVYHRRGSFGRSKFRVRRYDDRSEVFLERKLRRPGMLTKRRTPVALAVLGRLDEPSSEPWAGAWFERRLQLRRLRPICEVSYTRSARESASPSGPIRLTLDERLHVWAASGPEPGLRTGGVRILESSMILELKYRSTTPLVFKELAEEFALQPQAVSKYRLAAAALNPLEPRADLGDDASKSQAPSGGPP